MTKRTPPYSPDVRERAVRMVFDHQGEYGSQWAAIQSIAAKSGCSGEALGNRVRQSERDRGQQAGPTTDEGRTASRSRWRHTASSDRPFVSDPVRAILSGKGGSVE